MLPPADLAQRVHRSWIRFAATGDPDHFQALARRFLGPEVESVRRLETIGAPRPAAAPVPTRSTAFVPLGAEQEGVT